MEHEQQPTAAANNLFSAIQHYQLLLQEWRVEFLPRRREQVRYEISQTTELIYHLIEKPCQLVARRWMGLPAFVYTFSDAMGYMERLDEVTSWIISEIFLELTTIQLDVERNVVSLIKTIADRRLNDEYRKFRRRRAVVSATSLDDQNEEAMGYDDKLDEQFANEEEAREQRNALRQYCHTSLSGDEQCIVEWYTGDPPITHKEIARRLGPKWTEAAVRQRYRRIKQRMIEHFAHEWLAREE